ncbi:AI-2E family transporter [Paradesulfitobacterium aromaticivorans]
MKKESWRWIFFAVLMVLGVFLLFRVREILGPFIAAFVLAYLLCPLVNWLERHHLSRRTAIAVVFVGILAALALVIFLVLPLLYNELAKLSVVLPQFMQSLDKQVQDLRKAFRSTGLPNRVVTVFDQHLGRGEDYLAEKLQYFLSHLPEFLASLSLFILSPVLAIYFLADWHRLEAGFARLVQQRWRLEWQRVWRDISHVIRRFVRGNLVVAVIVGVLTGIGVKLLGMEYALLIGVICGVSDLIPYFGPVIGAVPSVALGLINSPWMALKVLLVILIVQQLESNVISPKIMGESVGLHPLWIIFALLAGGEIAGVWGMLIAVPVAAVLRVVIRHFYLRLVAPEI